MLIGGLSHAKTDRLEEILESWPLRNLLHYTSSHSERNLSAGLSRTTGDSLASSYDSLGAEWYDLVLGLSVQLVGRECSPFASVAGSSLMMSLALDMNKLLSEWQ